MIIEQVKDILSKKGFNEIISNDYGTLFTCDVYRIAIIFTDIYTKNNTEHYVELRNQAKKLILDIDYLDKSTLMVFNKTTDDLNETLFDTIDFIKSNNSILYFLPEERKKIVLTEMSSINDIGDIWINPQLRFHPNSFLNSMFKLSFKTNNQINIKYPPILYDTLIYNWLNYWINKLSI